MEKIYFDEKTFIYKARLDLSEFKDEILEECNKVISLYPVGTRAAYAIPNSIDDDGKIINPLNIVDKVVQMGIDNCIKANETSYVKVFHNGWVNILHAQNIWQEKGHGGAIDPNDRYHIHTEVGKLSDRSYRFTPKFTYVYYVQMPDNLSGNDGVLNVMARDNIGKNYSEQDHTKEYSILPAEGDLIIMESDLPHGPQPAYNSTKDRIVIVGNVGFLEPFKFSFSK
jgi:hypothetical protein